MFINNYSFIYLLIIYNVVLWYYWAGLHGLNLVTGSMSEFSSLSCLSRDQRNRLCTLGASLRSSTSLRYQLSHNLGLTVTPRACFILIISLRRTNWYRLSRWWVVVNADSLITMGWLAMLDELSPSRFLATSTDRSCSVTDFWTCWEASNLAWVVSNCW